MKIMNRRTLAATAADRWVDAYRGDRDGKAAAIRSLGESPDPDAVDAIIGNGSWTSVCRCYECNACPDEVVEIGEERDYESATTWLCQKCLRKALALFAPPEVK